MGLVAMDCEMVEVNNRRSAVGKVTIVNENGTVLLDKYVKPNGTITDYRTDYSGLTARHLQNADSESQVKNEVQNILYGNTLIGHDVQQDLAAWNISHPGSNTKDTTHKFGKRTLKELAKEYLGRHIQQGSHDSREDAIAAMDLYKKYRW